MLVFQDLSMSVLFAVGLALVMIANSVFIIFYHDTKHDQLDQWIDFSFSVNALRQALGYYRLLAVSMLFFYVLFTLSCVYLQFEGYKIFSDGSEAIVAGPISTALFGLDLVFRGGFFDIMEHFEIRLTTVLMNKEAFWFVIYAFVFRIFYGLSLIKILLSFAWIYGKIRLVRKSSGYREAQLKLFD